MRDTPPVKFNEAGPPGSLGMVITFADKVSIKVPMGPLSAITRSAINVAGDNRSDDARPA